METVLIAFAADLWVGDPLGRYHPVRAIGWLINFQEKLYRKWFSNLAPAGAVLFIVTVGVTFFAAFGIRYGLAKLHPSLAALWDILLVFFSLSVKGLGDEAFSLYRSLKNGNVEYAREKLSMLVGRDTGGLEKSGISRAAVETVSENLVDGVISPLFFAVIGGGPLAMAYKAVNTLDSMVGYRNEKYMELGRFSARADDAANFIPARLSVPLVAVAAFLLDYNWRSSWRIAMSDRLKHSSPNAAHPEAAFSGALNVELGGTASYGGVGVEKPKIGEGQRQPDEGDIADSVRLMRITAILALGLLTGAAFGLKAAI